MLFSPGKPHGSRAQHPYLYIQSKSWHLYRVHFRPRTETPLNQKAVPISGTAFALKPAILGVGRYPLPPKSRWMPITEALADSSTAPSLSRPTARESTRR